MVSNFSRSPERTPTKEMITEASVNASTREDLFVMSAEQGSVKEERSGRNVPALRPSGFKRLLYRGFGFLEVSWMRFTGF